jgi:4a-hydroxytetrahydrobiopterin dehydratase
MNVSPPPRPGARPAFDRTSAAIIINQLATPGLGSWIAGHRVAGAGQLLIACSGFCVFLVYFARLIIEAFHTAMGAEPVEPLNDALWRWGLILFGVSWVWSGITSLQIWSRSRRTAVPPRVAPTTPPDLAIPPSPAPVLPVKPLTPEEVAAAMAGVPGWAARDNAISRTYTFRDFPAAIAFVNSVARAAESANHHPDIDIRWNKVTLTLSTHDAGGVTEKDFALARVLDEEAAGND